MISKRLQRVFSRVRSLSVPEDGTPEGEELNQAFSWLTRNYGPFGRQRAREVVNAIFGPAEPKDRFVIDLYRLNQQDERAFQEFERLLRHEIRTGELEEKRRQEWLERTRAQREIYTSEVERQERLTRKVSRQDLYELVWSQPAKLLAADLGISDVMIGKLCRKYKIPKPYPGYWAKVQAGQRLERSPLPKLAGKLKDDLILVRPGIRAKPWWRD